MIHKMLQTVRFEETEPENVSTWTWELKATDREYNHVSVSLRDRENSLRCEIDGENCQISNFLKLLSRVFNS
jgi:hypothetical protein